MKNTSSSLFLKFTFVCFLFSFQLFYSQEFNVLVFHETNGFRHNAAINASISMLEDLGTNEAHDTWEVDNTRDASVFTIENLANYEVIVFSNTTGGDLLDDDQQAAMENFIQNGGGFVGFHSATDTYRATDEGSSWPWYNELVGAIVQTTPNHTSNNLSGTMNVLVDHPVIDHIGTIGDVWEHEEEWYYWELNGGQLSNTNENLLEVQSTGNESYDATRPITWLKEFDGGRSFYTALGHNATTYNDNESFREMVEKAILWVSNRLGDAPIEIEICDNENAPIGEIIALQKAGGDQKWVTVESGTNSLVANGDASESAYFIVEEHAEGCIALKELSTNLYVQVEGSQTNETLKANGSLLSEWENFSWEQVSDNQVALKSEFTNTWVQANWNQNNTSLFPLGQAQGAWETFNYVVVDEPVLTNVDNENSLLKGFSMHPNPFSSTLTFHNLTNGSVVVYSAKGEVVFTKNAISQSQVVNLESLKSGIYFVQLKLGDQILSKKIVKQ